MIQESLYKVSVFEQENAKYTVCLESCFQLILVSCESGKRILAGTVSEFQTMDMVLLPPGCGCIWESDSEDDIIITKLMFDDNFLKGGIFQKRFFSDIRAFISSDFNSYIFRDIDIIKETKEDVSSLVTNVDMTSYLLFLKILYKLSNSEYQTYSLLSTPIHPDLRMPRILMHIQKLFAKCSLENPVKCSLSNVAEYACLSPTVLSRLFSQKMRITFQTYVDEVRIKEFICRLYQQKDEGIKSIAYGCGFDSMSNFLRAFKKIYGMTPREYKKAIGQNGRYNK